MPRVSIVSRIGIALSAIMLLGPSVSARADLVTQLQLTNASFTQGSAADPTFFVDYASSLQTEQLAPQMYDPGQPLTFRFSPLLTGPILNETDLFFMIYNDSTGVQVYSKGPLSPTTTSLVVPPNTLAPSTTYDFRVDYIERSNSARIAEELVAFNAAATDSVNTLAVVPEPSTLTMAAMAAGIAIAYHRLRRRGPRV